MEEAARQAELFKQENPQPEAPSWVFPGVARYCRNRRMVTSALVKLLYRVNKDLQAMNNQLKQDRKQSVSKLKTLTLSTKRQWDGFCEYLDILISEQHTKLEKSDNVVSVHRAQGAIDALSYLKYLREEADRLMSALGRLVAKTDQMGDVFGDYGLSQEDVEESPRGTNKTKACRRHILSKCRKKVCLLKR
jgi:hypothetical protein